jgi:hypothetical protein
VHRTLDACAGVASPWALRQPRRHPDFEGSKSQSEYHLANLTHRVALGYEAADSIITNVRIVHVNTGAIREDGIAIKGDRIPAVACVSR